jgi:hypothetical protein
MRARYSTGYLGIVEQNVMGLIQLKCSDEQVRKLCDYYTMINVMRLTLSYSTSVCFISTHHCVEYVAASVVKKEAEQNVIPPRPAFSKTGAKA